MVIRNNVVTAVANGGAISSNTTRNITINNSLITENSAYHAGGLSIGNENQTFTMRDTIVSNNTATTGDIGGIQIVRGTVVIEKSQITGNVATRSFGGISVGAAATLDISDTIISGNDGMQDNGGGLATNGSEIVNLRRLTVSNNTGTGIAVRQVGGVFTLIDSTVSNNTLRDYTGFSGEGGGGIAYIWRINRTSKNNQYDNFRQFRSR